MNQSAAPSLRRARHLLTESGALPSGLIDSRLERSWLRSLAAGLTPLGRATEIVHLSAPEMRCATDRHHELIAHARPVMEHLFSQVRDAGNMVILADQHGLLLDALGEGDFLSRAERVTLRPGASWDEQHRGTNAIGTALREIAPLEIHGAEHFLDRNTFLTCAAAPILAPDFRLLGVLDISGDQRQRHPHTLGLARTATQMIENRLFTSTHRRDICLHLHPRAEGIGTVAEGLLALSEDGLIIGANRAGLHLFGLVVGDLGATPISRMLDCDTVRLIDWAHRQPNQSRPFTSHRGETLFVSATVGRDASKRSVPGAPAALPAAAGDTLAALNTGDKAMAAAIDRGRRIIGKAIPILLHGESGVGKELFACALHASGPRRLGPFVAVNCAALPENLIEAELFGYAPGAFTGASREGRPGRLREAHGGTLFLDEIGDMPLSLQSRLLRVLQERQVSPLGGGKAQSVDFALICATHRRLKDEVANGQFRADLYYRLNGLTLSLPPLRERDDFATLTHRLLNEISPDHTLSLSPDVARALAAYRWPGNLRQLANALRTAAALLDAHEDCIEWMHLPEDLAEDLLHATPDRPAPAECVITPTHAANPANSANSANSTNTLRALSHTAIERAIASVGGNLSEAARRLGISRNTLYRKLRQASPDSAQLSPTAVTLVMPLVSGEASD